MRRRLLGAAAGAVLLFAAPGALANGRFPASNQILFSPANPSWMIVRSTFGIIITKDAGASWSWLCEDILGLPPTSNEDPYLGLTQNDTLIAGLSLGLEVSTNTGCDWTFAGGPLKAQLIKDLAVHKDNPHIADVITSTYFPPAAPDGGDWGYTQQTYESIDDGKTWAALGTPIDPMAVVTTLDVAPSDPNRIYVSAFRGSGMTRTASLFVSMNKGMTWMEHQAPLDSKESAAYIGAVDPTNEDVVYLRTEGQSRLIVTQDGGQTFKPVKTMDDEMLGMTLSQDGSKVYVGSVADGLLVADTKTFTFTQTSMIHVQCLVTRGSELWACSDEVSGFAVGVSSDDGKTFTPKMHLLDVGGPESCGANSMAAQCTAWDDDAGAFYNPFVSLCSNLGACYDGGPPAALISTCSCTGSCNAINTSNAADYDAAATCPEAGPSSGGGGGGGGLKSGCSTAGGGSALGGLVAAALVGMVGRWRRRNRRAGTR